jgi:SAM-dependent methyltransferase
MEGFDPKTSFGYEVSKRYVDTRGDEVEAVAFLTGLAANADALEFAVGTGRIALPLQATGVHVDGIEQSEHMVDRMREKPSGGQIAVTLGDMSRVTTGRTYGLVYLVYNTIGNLLTQEDQVQCFENAARHLTDNGVFVLESQLLPCGLATNSSTLNISRSTTSDLTFVVTTHLLRFLTRIMSTFPPMV